MNTDQSSDMKSILSDLLTQLQNQRMYCVVCILEQQLQQQNSRHKREQELTKNSKASHFVSVTNLLGI